MDVVHILGLLSVVLACGCAGMFAVRLTNPRLLGMEWLGGAFASGAMGTALLFLKHRVPLFISMVVADVLLVLAFVLLHLAVVKLIEGGPFPRTSPILLFIQAAVDLFILYPLHDARHWDYLRVAISGLLIATQNGMTARLLMQRVRMGLRAPVWFTAGLMCLLDLLLVIRSIIIAGWLLDDPVGFHKIEGVTFLLYIPFTLAMGFGFFWITTAKLTASLEELASTDPLTRLCNRRSFLALCERTASKAARSGRVFSLLLLDLDHFKSINDLHGHATGDDVLRAAAEVLRNSVRSIDETGRWGGEEFAALLPEATTESALVVAERIRANLHRVSIPVNAQDLQATCEMVRITGSIGVSTWAGRGDAIDSMLARADKALYRAKQAGRDRVVFDPIEESPASIVPSDCIPI